MQAAASGGCRSACGRRRRARARRRGSRPMIPSPVHSGRYSIANGTAIPIGPGASQRSPSSVIPWTAIAISPASAACSWTAGEHPRQPGLADGLARPSRRPSVTENVISSSATIPDARLASHQPNSIGSRPVTPPPRSAPNRPAVRRPVGAERGAAVATRARLAPHRAPRRRPVASPADHHAAVAPSHARGRASRPGEQRGLGARLRLGGGRRDGGRGRATPVQAGRPVAGSIRWWATRRRRPTAGRRCPRWRPRRRAARARRRPRRSADGGPRTAWSPCTRMSPPQSTAHGPAAASRAATRSAMKPLALPPRSSRSARRARDRAGADVDRDASGGAPRVRRGGAARGRGRQRARARRAAAASATPR